MADDTKAPDETTTSTAAEKNSDPGAEATEAGTGATGGAGPEGGPVPGDASSEQVSTAAQSHVAGRVGPPTVAQDATATHHTPVGVPQIEPGEVVDAVTPMLGGPLPPSDPPAVVAARAVDEGPGDESTAGSGTKGAGTTSTASGPSGSPTLPTEGSASSHSPGSAGGAETADSGSGGSATGPAGSSGSSESGGSAGSSK